MEEYTWISGMITMIFQCLLHAMYIIENIRSRIFLLGDKSFSRIDLYIKIETIKSFLDVIKSMVQKSNGI